MCNHKSSQSAVCRACTQSENSRKSKHFQFLFLLYLLTRRQKTNDDSRNFSHCCRALIIMFVAIKRSRKREKQQQQIKKQNDNVKRRNKTLFRNYDNLLRWCCFYATSFLPSSSSNLNRKLKEFFLSTRKVFTHNKINKYESKLEHSTSVSIASNKKTYQNAFSFFMPTNEKGSEG